MTTLSLANNCESAHKRLDGLEKRVEDTTRRVDQIFGLLVSILCGVALTLLAVLMKR